MDLSNIKINAQSSIRIEGAKTLYFDPFNIDESVGDADYIFITHDHPDHFEVASIEKIKNENTILIAPLSMQKKIVDKSNISNKNLRFMNPDDSIIFEGIVVKAVPAYNNILPFHIKQNKWLGYVVTMDDVAYYIAGDTDENKDNKKVSCDVAIVPAGGKFTMNSKQAAKFVLDINPKAAIPSHYGQFIGKATDGADFKSIVEAGNSSIQVELKL